MTPFKLLSIVLAVSLLTRCGCAGARHGAARDDSTPGKDEALAFGRIVIMEDGADMRPYKERPVASLTIVRADGGSTELKAEVEEDGGFYWVLPAGDCYIEEIEYSGWKFKPWVAFNAPYPSVAFYAGTLMVGLSSKGPQRGGHRAVSSVDVVDEYGAEADALLERNPGFAYELNKGLMAHYDYVEEPTERQTQRPMLFDEEEEGPWWEEFFLLIPGLMNFQFNGTIHIR
jgi:hypothetical protein